MANLTQTAAEGSGLLLDPVLPLTDGIPTSTGTSTTLISSVNPSTIGQGVTFTATVIPASGVTIPTGTVTFLDLVTTIGTGSLDPSGVATFSTSILTLGFHNITAAYGGDTNYDPSTSSVL